MEFLSRLVVFASILMMLFGCAHESHLSENAERTMHIQCDSANYSLNTKTPFYMKWIHNGEEFESHSGNYVSNTQKMKYYSPVLVHLKGISPDYLIVESDAWRTQNDIMPQSGEVISFSQFHTALKIPIDELTLIKLSKKSQSIKYPKVRKTTYNGHFLWDMLVGALGGVAFIGAGTLTYNGIYQNHELGRDRTGGALILGAILGAIGYPVYNLLHRSKTIEVANIYQQIDQMEALPIGKAGCRVLRPGK